MRGTVWIVLLFVAAVVAASTLGRNDGMVSLVFGGWRTDLSLNLFVLLLVGGGALLVFALQAISALVSLPRRAEEWRALRRERAANQALRDALADFLGARYSRARKAAQRALQVQPLAPALAADADFRRLAQLLAANSLHRLQDRAERDAVLQQALGGTALPPTPLRSGASSAEEALSLCAAEWALDDRDATRALALLDGLSPGAARRTQALRLRMQASRLARQPLVALQTARLLANHQAFSPAVAQGLLRSLAAEAMDQVHDAGQLKRLWSQFDEADRRDPQVVARALARAAKVGGADEARQWLRPLWERLGELSREDRDALALALIEVREGIGVDWLQRMETAVHHHGQESAVAAAAGMVLAQRGLWGKARPLLTQAATTPALPAATRRAAWRQLAAMAIDQGETARAQECESSAAALD